MKRLTDLGLQSKQYSFDLDAQSDAGKIFQGLSPSKDGIRLDATEQAPEGFPLEISVERPEEFSPGADRELLALIEATAAMEMADIDAIFGRLGLARHAYSDPARADAQRHRVHLAVRSLDTRRRRRA